MMVARLCSDNAPASTSDALALWALRRMVKGKLGSVPGATAVSTRS